MKEKIYTLKYVLNGLYNNEKEIEEFLRTFHFSLNFISPLSHWRLLYNLRKYKKLQLYHQLRYVFAIRDRFCGFKGIKGREGSPLFLIRIDDFPHWEKTLDDFKRFHSIMEDFEAPYLLGVTPYLSLNRHNPFNNNFKLLEDKEVKLIKHPLIEIAMHGLSHQTNSSKVNREFAGLTTKEVKQKIEEGLEILRKFDIRPSAFIPPFDRTDRVSYRALTKYFKSITGGPDSCKTLGYTVSPAFLKGAIYVPSYRPLCNRCYEIASFLKKNEIKKGVILPIAIHWANELTEDNYESLKELLKMIKGSVLNWNDLQKFIL